MSTSARLSSPAVLGTVLNTTFDAPSDRQAALGMADSFGEVIAVLPTTYRETLRPHLRRLADIASKCDGVRVSVSRLRRHKAESTWPPQLLGVHKPRFELTREFSETSPGTVANMDAAFAAYRIAALDSAIELKSAEVDHLETLLRPQTYMASLFTVMATSYEGVKQKHQQPNFDPALKGEVKITGWAESPIYLNEYKRLCMDLASICSRLILIERSKGQAEEAKKNAKSALKQAADVEMGDATVSSASITDIVQKELAAALKKVNLGNVSTLLSDRFFNHPLTARMLSDSKSEGWKEEGFRQLEGGQEDQVFGVFERKGKGLAQAVGQNPQEAKTVERRERQREAESIVSASRIRYDVPSSYPDEILNLPSPLAIRYLLRSVRPDVLEAARFRAEVHVGPGVVIPSRLQIHLSTGLKFMFFRRPAASVLRDAWSDFTERLRWRCYWTMKEATGNLSPRPYDPDYEVDRERSACDYREPYIEHGLAEGHSYVENFIHDVIPTLKTSSRLSNLVQVTELQEFLVSNEYIVTLTDKNLGCSVITRQWFIDNCNLLLADTSNYQEITKAERQVTLEKQCDKAKDLATFVDEQLEHPQLSAFLRSKVPLEETEEPKVPVFYGIPKIHKKPVKMRPIVPCHSAVQNPAAKYVSKQLKPLLAERPFLLRGSKDLATKLASLKLQPGRKVYLVSGDIVAFYPNIPRDKCVEIVKTWFMNWIGDRQTLAQKHVFSACLKLATRDLIFDFMDRTYRQSKGLAMGVANSPDLANLFGCHYEEQILPIDDIPFFGRFIDDVLAVVYADSLEDALAKASVIQYESVEIEWSASEHNTPFLDLLVYIDHSTGRVEHKPYRKARNHLERIPWVSAHPKDVKKGTFIGEMSRLATLSSTVEVYTDALDHLRSVYVARGYPPDLIKSWLKDNASKRWRNRLGRTESAGDVFVLKSHFNPIWDSFDIHELGRVVINRWLGFLESQDALNRQLDMEDQVELFGGNPADKLFELGLGQDGNPRVTVLPMLKSDPRRVALREKALVVMTGAQVARSESPDPVVGSEEPLIRIRKTIGRGPHIEDASILDIRKLGYHQRKWLVSRKRNFNLYDLVASLKKSVLYLNFNDDIIVEENVDTWD